MFKISVISLIVAGPKGEDIGGETCEAVRPYRDPFQGTGGRQENRLNIVEHASIHLLMPILRKPPPTIVAGIPAIKPITMNFHPGIPSKSSLLLVYTLIIILGNIMRANPKTEISPPIKKRETQ
jgi:hypothetical protein